jgi:hypothetical protein
LILLILTYISELGRDISFLRRGFMAISKKLEKKWHHSRLEGDPATALNELTECR